MGRLKIREQKFLKALRYPSIFKKLLGSSNPGSILHVTNEDLVQPYPEPVKMGFAMSELPSAYIYSQTNSVTTIPNDEKDAWLGQIHLAGIIGPTLHRKTSASVDITTLNEKLSTAMAHFRLSECWPILENRGVLQCLPQPLQNVTDPNMSILSVIGAVMRGGTDQQKSDLYSTLHEKSEMMEFDHPPAQSALAVQTQSASPSSQSASLEPPTAGTEDMSETDLSRYTSLLWEHAAKLGERPVEEPGQISVYPPRFRLQVTLAGQTAVGEGRKKKLAKHIASKALCESMGIGFA